MNLPRRTALRSLASLLVLPAVAAVLVGCAALPGNDPVRVNVVGVEPLSGQGLELRFNVRLRVVNPNDTPIDYDGVFVDLDLQGRNFAAGASDIKGSVPRFGEKVLEVPISVSALGALRQMLGLATNGPLPDRLAYELRGKIGGPAFNGLRFSSKGELSLGALAR